MEKFKVKVTNASEVLEIENILSKIGLVSCNYSGFSYPKYIANNIDGEFSDYTMLDSGIDKFKLLTINELKDMVVLMQNNPKDANVYQDGDIPCLYDLYLTGSEELYFYHCGKKAWILSNLNHDKGYYELLKPIKEEVMKEFLNPEQNYSLVECRVGETPIPESWIEVPEGAEKYIQGVKYPTRFGFVKGYKFWDGEWVDHVDLAHEYNVVWQREKESLNDKIATAEVARQEEKHNHYKKDVSHLDVIDPYRISDLYDLHPCADHIMKKSLCAGNRGHKDALRDIQDIIDTAERWKQMVEEDNNEI